MPRGIFRTNTGGRLNTLQAGALAKRIRAEHPDWRAEKYHIAQGLAGVEIVMPGTWARFRVHTEAEYLALVGQEGASHG